ncbi:MAG: 23S rRNA (adenine(2030)-N(6))-methyltransferase RlmJ [Reyranella sp.]|nr:23S rRNA (adenine(2030)-N(6))-methyltransferase RlmJ [Reyranella sp.]
MPEVPVDLRSDTVTRPTAAPRPLVARAAGGGAGVNGRAPRPRAAWGGLAGGSPAAKGVRPPPEPRGLPRIGPAFEATDEFEVLLRALRHGLRRFATGCYAVWYPIKDPEAVRSFMASVADTKPLVLELRLGRAAPPGRLAACGLAVINPPWKFEEAMREALPWIAARLGPEVRASVFDPQASAPARASGG